MKTNSETLTFVLLCYYFADNEIAKDGIENLKMQDSIIENERLPKSDYPNGKVTADNMKISSVADKKLTIEIANEEIVSDSELTTESEDKVDSALKPLTQKEHATQDTLNFVYKHGIAASPNHTGGSFPLFSGAASGYQNSAIFRSNNGSQRRPSGVPPPARALKPEDYLYKRTMNARRHSDMAEAAEEDENEENT